MNVCVLIGNLTKDIELRYSKTGTAIANFTIAVQREYKNANGEKETDFIPVVAYKALAELASNYLSKGKKVAVEGRLQIRTYEDNEGQKRWVTEIIASNIQFLSPKDSGNQAASSQKGDSGAYGHEVSMDDDIPF